LGEQLVIILGKDNFQVENLEVHELADFQLLVNDQTLAVSLTVNEHVLRQKASEETSFDRRGYRALFEKVVKQKASAKE
jgi:hypothetical protein